MSIARAECVRAPAETKSTPASAAARAVSGVMRPEASVVTSAPVASLKSFTSTTAFGHRGGRHVVEQDALGAGVERLVHLVERARLGLEEEAAQAAVQRAEVGGAPRRLPVAAGAVGVVVLHEEAAREAGAVIRAAAAAHRVPLEGAEAGRRLPRVEEDGRTFP